MLTKGVIECIINKSSVERAKEHGSELIYDDDYYIDENGAQNKK